MFGVWHRPNGHYIHKGGCYNVEYVTNSYGARDVERTMRPSLPRAVVLGDSFIEGMAVPAEDRLTNLLEKDTGREHLNFGTGGDFGPLQYSLLYKTMAADFDHDLVIVGVLPDNDFHDMSLSYWKARGKAGRYRPYYADDLSIVYGGHFRPNAGEGLWDHVEAVLRAYLALTTSANTYIRDFTGACTAPIQATTTTTATISLASRSRSKTSRALPMRTEPRWLSS